MRKIFAIISFAITLLLISSAPTAAQTITSEEEYRETAGAAQTITSEEEYRRTTGASICDCFSANPNPIGPDTERVQLSFDKSCIPESDNDGYIMTISNPETGASVGRYSPTFRRGSGDIETHNVDIRRLDNEYSFRYEVALRKPSSLGDGPVCLMRILYDSSVTGRGPGLDDISDSGEIRVDIDPDRFRLTADTLNSFNPLMIMGGNQDLTTPGGIINQLLAFAFPLAGLILFVMIVWGGFTMVSGASNKKALDDGKKRIVAAVIGFILLFIAYWIMQILEVIFGVQIVNW